MNENNPIHEQESDKAAGGYAPILSGDPVRDNLRSKGITPNHQELQKALERLSPKAEVKSEPIVSIENKDQDLSPFARWLVQLDEPMAPVTSSLPPTDELQNESISEEADHTELVIEVAKEPKIEAEDQHDSRSEEAEMTEKRLKKKKKRKAKLKAQRKKDKKKKKKAKKAEQRAKKRSVGLIDAMPLADDVFSETLAKLLADRGHHDQAIAMYEKLSLIYPEKSRLFAAKIEELKQQK